MTHPELVATITFSIISAICYLVILAIELEKQFREDEQLRRERRETALRQLQEWEQQMEMYDRITEAFGTSRQYNQRFWQHIHISGIVTYKEKRQPKETVNWLKEGF